MASPNLKVSNPNEGTENPTPTPSMDKPKTVATALEKIYYRLGGAGIVPSGTDVATLTWAISELVSEGGGGSSGGVLVVTETWNSSGTTATLDANYKKIKEAVLSGKSVILKGSHDGYSYVDKLRFAAEASNGGQYVVSFSSDYSSATDTGALTRIDNKD